ncbi:MAG TPA: GNAT family N-acetyltransferase [Chloroflexia bacterium]|nr:GNAT family N-acetyltransferase [Chloroflexia bacterium]
MQPEEPKKITIRPVRVEDAEAIWEISRQAGVIETIMTLPSERLGQRSRQLQDLTPDDHYFVAEVENRVAGLAGLTVGQGRTRHSGYIFLFVGAAFQGMGVGTRLLETLIDLADNWLLLKRVELTVMAGNERARRLYEKAGFVVEGHLKFSVISQGEIKDEWLMARYH